MIRLTRRKMVRSEALDSGHSLAMIEHTASHGIGPIEILYGTNHVAAQ